MMKLTPIVPARLKEKMKANGFTQATLAKAVNVDQATISNLISGKISNSRHLPNIAKTLFCSIDYLLGLTDDPEENLPAIPTNDELIEELDLVKVMKVKNEYGLGETFLDEPENLTPIYVSREWLQNFTDAHPRDVVLIKAVGNSMEPTISNGDILVCDKSKTSPTRMDEFWVFTHWGMGGIKRIRKDAEGQVILLSDNPMVPDQVATLSTLNIMARVEAIVKRV